MDPSPRYDEDHPLWRDEMGNPLPNVTREQQKESLYEYVDLMEKIHLAMKELKSMPDDDGEDESFMSYEESERKKAELLGMFERVSHLSDMMGEPAPEHLRKSLDITQGLGIKPKARMSAREAREKKRRALRGKDGGEGGGQ
ncbi:hypothetical protein CDD82_3667 [Ophiocordyceps australis]|uniref:Uncharacterized protein n=1 Tax=Ophiocordyceps australis TaxID=1399860 RepID=A0A2C5ZBF5_9HYPO|nr:hypothetical protein CDD82_3667 [Ophiocordyceps australis]